MPRVVPVTRCAVLDWWLFPLTEFSKVKSFTPLNSLLLGKTESSLLFVYMIRREMGSGPWPVCFLPAFSVLVWGWSVHTVLSKGCSQGIFAWVELERAWSCAVSLAQITLLRNWDALKTARTLMFSPQPCSRTKAEEFYMTGLEVYYVGENGLRPACNQLAALTLVIPRTGSLLDRCVICLLLSNFTWISVTCNLGTASCCGSFDEQEQEEESNKSPQRVAQNRIKCLDAFITPAEAIVQAHTMLDTTFSPRCMWEHGTEIHSDLQGSFQ